MLFALVLCWSLQSIWRASFGPFLQWLANVGISFSAVVTHVNLHPFRFAAKIDLTAQKLLSEGIRQSEKRFVQALSQLLDVVALFAAVPVALALATYEGLHALWSHVTTQVPRVIHQTIVRPVERAQKAVTGITRATFNALSQRVQVLAAQVRHLAATIPHAIPNVIPRLGHLERAKIDYKNLHKWIKRVLLGALGATITLAALKRLGLAWTRCTNVSKLGKRVCGAHPQWLSDFLAAMTVIVGAASVVEFCQEAQVGEELAFDLLQGFVRELKGLDLDRTAAAALGFATITDEP